MNSALLLRSAATGVTRGFSLHVPWHGEGGGGAGGRRRGVTREWAEGTRQPPGEQLIVRLLGDAP